MSTYTAHKTATDGYECDTGEWIVDEKFVETRLNQSSVWTSTPDTSTSHSNKVSYKSDNVSYNSSFNKRIRAFYNDVSRMNKVDEGYETDVE